MVSYWCYDYRIPNGFMSNLAFSPTFINVEFRYSACFKEAKLNRPRAASIHEASLDRSKSRAKRYATVTIIGFCFVIIIVCSNCAAILPSGVHNVQPSACCTA